MRLGASPDRLDSWKEIASYLKREVRTVQLWEKREGMPVHRHFHNQLGTVFAFRSEIEEWSRQAARRQANKNQSAARDEEAIVQHAVSQEAAMRISVESLDIGGIPLELHAVTTQVISLLEKLDPSKLMVIRCKSGLIAEGHKSAENFPKKNDYLLCWKVVTAQAHSEEQCCKLQANLIAPCTGDVVWTQQFEVAPSDSGQLEILAEQIVQCIWLKIASATFTVTKFEGRSNTRAREAYLKGRFFQSRRNEEGLRRAVDWFRAAIQLDPEYPLPYSGLADSLNLLSFYEMTPSSEAIPEARRSALRALELDGSLAEARASLAYIHLHFDRDWVRADEQYRRAIECNPGYSFGYHWYASLLAARGQHEAAHTAIAHALDIDPVSVITQVWAGVMSYLAHRFDDAISYYRNALELDPNFLCAHMYMAQTLEQVGKHDEALKRYETASRLSGGNHSIMAMKAHALAVAGERSSARKILQGLRRSTDPRCMPSYDIAATYAALGDLSQSVQWLNRACSERHMKLFSLTQDPRFDEFRGRPEFRQVIEKAILSH